ncbi:thiamine pyrophosphate-binding protein [Glaciimonas sp. Gout2]|uniref:thiamine pyrophosphate-binding protein n=1 Tax=unclassified Glaciimonas TaxID=2644401 RepID=UPI002B22DDE5|nr:MULTISPECIES: thiamine pyrophosphate-binding protein [unclassified Glaciimonas]MEB0010500.1 thiamine pyrophosphate-binding protein [Glaciimonas sp. Cout2]MEB0083550.1 thiamine pyrophosphate-binding protein [Glaciimonas sp. Gout2]
MPNETIRGADLLVRTLERFGVEKIFSLSGNHIMPVYDALVDTAIDLIHVRHEAACVHMADAYARLTGEVGIALVTGGQGHANGTAALATALAAESPVILLSGHAGLNELGKGAFQEMRQAEFCRELTKASWTVQSAAAFGHDLARAMQIARSGRPGPVHLSLPVDLLEQAVPLADNLWPGMDDAERLVTPLSDAVADLVLMHVAAAAGPLIVCGPTFCSVAGRTSMQELSRRTGAPVVGMESPRGINDPGLGAYAQVVAQASLIVLLGKPLDFTLCFGQAPAIDALCHWIVIDPERALLDRAAGLLQKRMLLATLAAPADAMLALLKRAVHSGRSAHACGVAAAPDNDWLVDASALIAYRPPQWRAMQFADDQPVHPVALGRALQAFIDRHPRTTLVCDGGEIGQWPQATVQVERRLINGVAGAIGPSLPFALAAKAANPEQPVLAVMGDGTFGFHMAEFDTAVRHGLSVIVVVGNDARWNAEYQIQVRNYGAARTLGCDLLPTRYEKVAQALGGHGEYVATLAALVPALERAAASGKPACLNVMLQSTPAPMVRCKY